MPPCHICMEDMQVGTDIHDDENVLFRLTGIQTHTSCFISSLIDPPSMLVDEFVEATFQDNTFFNQLEERVNDLNISDILTRFGEKLVRLGIIEEKDYTRSEDELYRSSSRKSLKESSKKALKKQRRKKNSIKFMQVTRETRRNQARKIDLYRGLVEYMESLRHGSAEEIMYEAADILGYIYSEDALSRVWGGVGNLSIQELRSILESSPSMELIISQFLMSNISSTEGVEILDKFATISRMYCYSHIINGRENKLDVARIIRKKFASTPEYQYLESLYGSAIVKRQCYKNLVLFKAFLSDFIGGAFVLAHQTVFKKPWRVYLEWIESGHQGDPPYKSKIKGDPKCPEYAERLIQMKDSDMYDTPGRDQKFLMCPRCKYGPIIKAYCDDMSGHHGTPNTETFKEYSDNRCPHCHFFANFGPTHDVTGVPKWSDWTGFLRQKDTDVFPPKKLSDIKSQDIQLVKPSRAPCFPYLERDERDEEDSTQTLCQGEDVTRVLQRLLNAYKEEETAHDLMDE